MKSRYDRQEMIKGWDPKVIRGANILVIGAGTTGNEVIKNLVLLGIGRITVVDMDMVEEVNLSRSVLFRDADIGEPKAEIVAKRAMELNPDVQVIGRTCNVIYGIGNLDYGNYDCAILTVDNLEARMWVNRYCWINKTPVIDTGIGGLNGNVFVMVPPSGPCIECGWMRSDYDRLNERFQCLKLGLLLEEAKVPMVITSAAIIGGMAIQECTRLLHDLGRGNATKAGVFYLYRGEAGVLLSWQESVRDRCPGHGESLDQRKILKVRALLDKEVRAIKEEISHELGASEVKLWYDKVIVYSVICNNSGCSYKQVIEPTFLGRFTRFLCPKCSKLSVVPDDYTAELRDEYTLLKIGVPTNHLLRVDYAKEGAEGKAEIITR